MKRRGILQFIKNCLNDEAYNTRVSNDKEILEAVVELQLDLYKHYGFLDIERKSHHQLRFYLLYIENNNKTFEEIAEQTFVGVDGFKKYVKFYNQTALEWVTRQSQISLSYSYLLYEYRKSRL